MRLLRFFKTPKRLKHLLLLRRVQGRSMLPVLPHGKIVAATSWYRALGSGDVIIFNHGGMEKIKQVSKVMGDKLYVVGANESQSTDSRHFGSISTKHVLGKVISRINKKAGQ